MPIFCTFANRTDQGIKNIEEAPVRAFSEAEFGALVANLP